MPFDIAQAYGRSFDPDNEVNLDVFTRLFASHRLRNQFDATLVWEEIRSIIKGALPQVNLSVLRKALKGNAKTAEALTCTAHGQAGTGLTLGMMTSFLAKSRDEAALREVWIGWRKISPGMRSSYQRYVELGNEGARQIGLKTSATCGAAATTCRPKNFALTSSVCGTK